MAHLHHHRQNGRAPALAAALVAALVLGSAATAARADDTETPSAAARESACSPLPPVPQRPAKVRTITEFGVKPDDGSDASDAIQRALDKLAPGEWLVFPPGRYQHSKALHVKVPNTVLWGDGATLHATDPAHMAVWLEADGASIYNFTLTAVTDKRRSAPWESRITVFGGSKPSRLLSGNVIRGNKVIESGPPGSPLANSSGSAAIFIYHATGFLVAENTVSRSLSDGIHVTSGSSYGRVLKNTVRETGDDMIAVVSYVGGADTKADAVAADFDERRARGLSHHILISGNTVSGQYWGRGITVVGGENVTIENNIIDRPSGAAIYLARETSYLTFGVNDIVVRNNRISDVTTKAPDYTVRAAMAKPGHGAIEIYSWLYEDEAANPRLKDALAVENIRVEGNTITRTGADGVRIGTGWGRVWPYTAKTKEGGTFTRNVTGGQVGWISLRGNKLAGVASQPIAINNAPTDKFNVACEDNSADDKPAANKLCQGPPPRVQGACAN